MEAKMKYEDAVVFIRRVLRSVNVNADQHESISAAFEIILRGPQKEEPENVNNAVPISGAIQPGQ
jgi:hypothetical protein